MVRRFYYEGNDLAGPGYETENTLKNYLTNREFSQNLKNKQEEIDELVEKIPPQKIQPLNLKDLKLNNIRKKFQILNIKKKIIL